MVDENNKYEVRRMYMKNSPQHQEAITDQERGLPQPPLCKPAMTSASISLPKDFKDLMKQESLPTLLHSHRSQRSLADEPIALAQLSFLLWATQGVNEVDEQKNCTHRTVPSGGARHTFETYLCIRKVEGLLPGVYHYLPLGHGLELLHALPEPEEKLLEAMDGQSWTLYAPVVFFWSCVAYRGEWRYGAGAHRVMAIDMGHVGQNLYLAAAALGLGGCCVASYCQEACDEMLGIDGEEEYTLYTAAVGKVRDKMKESTLVIHPIV